MKNASAAHGPMATANYRPALLAIDGKVSGSLCATTLASTSPWLRVDLRTAYFITSVEALFWRSRGDGAVVRVGSNLTNDGNVNPMCGQPISFSAQGWTRTTCSPPLWGRYINVQKTSSQNISLSVCELRANYSNKFLIKSRVNLLTDCLLALDVGILYNNSSVESGAIYSYPGKRLPFPVLCGVNPDPTNFNSLLSIQWKDDSNGNLIPSWSSNPYIGQSKMSNLTSLYITKAPSVDKKYSCHFTWIDQTTKSLVFNLNINGEQLASLQLYILDYKHMCLVDCTWSAWSECSSCGVITRQRTANDAIRRHQGKQCIGSWLEVCNIKSVPCKRKDPGLNVVSSLFFSRRFCSCS